MSKLQGNSSFKNSIRNMQLEKFKKTTVAGIPIKQSTETLEDYIYTKKGQQDTTLANGEKYTITGFFQVTKVSTYIKVINTNNTNKVIYNDSSINVTLSGDKSYIYFEGKLSNTPLKYKFYFAANVWKQIVTEDNTEVEKEITKFNELSYFYDETKCSDPYLLALLSGLDGVDYEEILVKLKDALNNLSEFNYGYTNTGIKYGNRYMLPKNLSLATLMLLTDSEEGDSIEVSEISDLLNEITLYEQNANIQKQFTNFTNGNTYILPETINAEDTAYIQEKAVEYYDYTEQMYELMDNSGGGSSISDQLPALHSTTLSTGTGYVTNDGDSGYAQLDPGIRPISKNNGLMFYFPSFGGILSTMYGSLVNQAIQNNASIMDTVMLLSSKISKINGAKSSFYNSNLRFSPVLDNLDPLLIGLMFSNISQGTDSLTEKTMEYVLDPDGTYFTQYSNGEEQLTSIKYDTSLPNYVLEAFQNYANSLEDGEEKTYRLNECSIFRNMLTTSDLILKRLLNSGAQAGPFDDYKYSYKLDFDNALSLLTLINGGSDDNTWTKDDGSSGSSTKGRVTKVSSNNMLTELNLYSFFKFRIKSTTRNIDLQYNLGTLNWYDSNGNLINPNVEDLKFTITEDDYVSPILNNILQLNPYNEFEKEAVKMTELGKAYYSEGKITTIPSFAMVQLNDDLLIEPTTDSYETIKAAVWNFLGIQENEEPSEQENNEEVSSGTEIVSISGDWTETIEDNIECYKSNSIGSSGSTSIIYTVSGVGKIHVHIKSNAEAGCDYCIAYFDGNQILSTEENNNVWIHELNIEINDDQTHTIEVVYQKDGSVNNYPDCGYCYVTLNNELDYTAKFTSKSFFKNSLIQNFSIINSESEYLKFFNFLDANPSIKNNLFNLIYDDLNINDYAASVEHDYHIDDYFTYIVADFINKNGHRIITDMINNTSEVNNNLELNTGITVLSNYKLLCMSLINYEELYLIMQLLYTDHNYDPTNDEEYSYIQGKYKIEETIATGDDENPYETYIYTKDYGWINTVETGGVISDDPTEWTRV